MDQAASAHQAFYRQHRECGEGAGLDRDKEMELNLTLLLNIKRLNMFG